jgi:hypothetical protein
MCERNEFNPHKTFDLVSFDATYLKKYMQSLGLNLGMPFVDCKISDINGERVNFCIGCMQKKTKCAPLHEGCEYALCTTETNCRAFSEGFLRDVSGACDMCNRMSRAWTK